jgi:hypothetical protein
MGHGDCHLNPERLVSSEVEISRRVQSKIGVSPELLEEADVSLLQVNQ